MAFGKRHPILYILMVTVTSNCMQDAHAGKICGPYKWGKRFFFAVPGHYYSNFRNQLVSYNISIGIQAKEAGTVNIFAKGQNISANYDIIKGTTSLNVPQSVVQSYGQPSIQRKGIRITSTTKVSAKLVVKGNFKSWHSFQGEMDLVPISATSSKSTIPFYGSMGIHIVGLKKTGFKITYLQDGKRQTIEGRLRKFDSFLLNGTFPSGIDLISSNKPVVIFYQILNQDGHEYGYVQQIPTNLIGKKYIIPSISYSFYLRAVALYNDTFLEVKRNSQTYIMMLNEGEYIQSYLNGHVVGLSSNKEVIVTRYRDIRRSNAIESFPALPQYCNGYKLYVNSRSYLTVVAESHYKDEFVFHERDIPWWSQVSYIVMNGTEYFVAKVTLDKGDDFRKVYLRSKNATFGGFLGNQPLGTRD